MPKYNDISIRYTPVASTGGGGVSSITLNNGVTSISGDLQFINGKGTGTLDVVASIVRGSHTVLGLLDVTGISTHRSAANFTNGLDVTSGASSFKSISADSIITTGSGSLGSLVVGGLSRLGAVTTSTLQGTSISSTGSLSAGSLVIGGTSSLQGGLSVVGSSNLAGVSATTLVSGTLTVSGSTTLAGINASSLSVSNNSTLGNASATTLGVSGQSIINDLYCTSISATSLAVQNITTAGLIATGSTSLATTTISGLTSTSIVATSTISTPSITTGILAVTGASNMASLDLTGNLTVAKIYEKVNIVDAVTLVLDINLGNSFVLPLSFMPTANYSISIINVPLDINNKILSVSLINRQATTTFYVNNLKVSNVSNQYILGTASSVASAIFNGGVPSFTTSPCLMIQSFNILSIPDTSNSLGTYSRFVTSSVNCHY
jgi:hypothetical protein